MRGFFIAFSEKNEMCDITSYPHTIKYLTRIEPEFVRHNF